MPTQTIRLTVEVDVEVPVIAGHGDPRHVAKNMIRARLSTPKEGHFKEYPQANGVRIQITDREE